MPGYIKKLIGSNKEYKRQMKRAGSLPEDYRFVFEKIHGYIWRFAGGDGLDMIEVQRELLDLFETAAADGKLVLDITGEDVAAFCDDFLRDTKKWTDSYRVKLNKDMNSRFGRKGDSR